MVKISKNIPNKDKKTKRYNKSIEFFSIKVLIDFIETKRPAIVKYNGILVALSIIAICE